jgi:hypothetical protein
MLKFINLLKHKPHKYVLREVITLGCLLKKLSDAVTFGRKEMEKNCSKLEEKSQRRNVLGVEG